MIHRFTGNKKGNRRELFSFSFRPCSLTSTLPAETLHSLHPHHKETAFTLFQDFIYLNTQNKRMWDIWKTLTLNLQIKITTCIRSADARTLPHAISLALKTYIMHALMKANFRTRDGIALCFHVVYGNSCWKKWPINALRDVNKSSEKYTSKHTHTHQMATPPPHLLHRGPRGNRSKPVPPEWGICGSQVSPSLFLRLVFSL